MHTKTGDSSTINVEDTKVVIRIRQQKDRQCNGQKYKQRYIYLPFQLIKCSKWCSQSRSKLSLFHIILTVIIVSCLGDTYDFVWFSFVDANGGFIGFTGPGAPGSQGFPGKPFFSCYKSMDIKSNVFFSFIRIQGSLRDL